MRPKPLVSVAGVKPSTTFDKLAYDSYDRLGCPLNPTLTVLWWAPLALGVRAVWRTVVYLLYHSSYTTGHRRGNVSRSLVSRHKIISSSTKLTSQLKVSYCSYSPKLKSHKRQAPC